MRGQPAPAQDSADISCCRQGRREAGTWPVATHAAPHPNRQPPITCAATIPIIPATHVSTLIFPHACGMSTHMTYARAGAAWLRRPPAPAWLRLPHRRRSTRGRWVRGRRSSTVTMCSCTSAAVHQHPDLLRRPWRYVHAPRPCSVGYWPHALRALKVVFEPLVPDAKNLNPTPAPNPRAHPPSTASRKPLAQRLACWRPCTACRPP